MKKIFKICTLFLVFGLVACSGKAISKEEAIGILTTIKEKEEAEELEAPDTFRLEMKESATAGDESASGSAIFALDSDAKRVYLKAQEKNVSAGETEEHIDETWVYEKDNTYYFLNNNDGDKTYFASTEASAEEYYEFHADYVKSELSSITSSFSASSLILALELLETMELLLGVEVEKETYRSKGDGHLKGEITINMPATSSSSSATSEMSFTYEDYRLVQYETVYEDSESSSEELMNINYAKSGITLPSLSGFTLVE